MSGKLPFGPPFPKDASPDSESSDEPRSPRAPRRDASSESSCTGTSDSDACDPILKRGYKGESRAEFDEQIEAAYEAAREKGETAKKVHPFRVVFPALQMRWMVKVSESSTGGEIVAEILHEV